MFPYHRFSRGKESIAGVEAIRIEDTEPDLSSVIHYVLYHTTSLVLSGFASVIHQISLNYILNFILNVDHHVQVTSSCQNYLLVLISPAARDYHFRLVEKIHPQMIGLSLWLPYCLISSF